MAWQPALPRPPKVDPATLPAPSRSSLCLTMISAQALRACREGKPVPTFPDHALSPLRGGLARLEAASRPGDLNHGAMVRKDPVGKGDLCARALQQGAGDKHAETKTTMGALDLSRTAPPRQIGFADALEHLGRDPRPVIENDDLNGLSIPPRVHLHGRPGEIDGVFQDVADPIKDRWISGSDRLGGARNRNSDL